MNFIYCYLLSSPWVTVAIPNHNNSKNIKSLSIKIIINIPNKESFIELKEIGINLISSNRHLPNKNNHQPGKLSMSSPKVNLPPKNLIHFSHYLLSHLLTMCKTIRQDINREQPFSNLLFSIDSQEGNNLSLHQQNLEIQQFQTLQCQI